MINQTQSGASWSDTLKASKKPLDRFTEGCRHQNRKDHDGSGTHYQTDQE
ncbi:hypothetical protein [Pseudomonas syringae]|nr:hypothetical protein [Pseudomonas syringae]MDF5773313.1 hypothetical protein [Pseudomonas syringae pv. syringae]